ncbi:CAP domain-containing protein [Kitasatospora sp. NPDC001159]
MRRVTIGLSVIGAAGLSFAGVALVTATDPTSNTAGSHDAPISTTVAPTETGLATPVTILPTATPASPAAPAAPSQSATPSPTSTPSSLKPTPKPVPTPARAAHPSAANTAAPASKPAATAQVPADPGSGPVGPDPVLPGPRSSSQSVSDAEAASLQLLNGERATVGLPPLTLKTDLSDYARNWAHHMRDNGFGHSSSANSQYLVTGSRTWIGENIVWWSDASMTAQEAAEKFQSMWRHSPGHYKAQTNPSFTEVGVGIYHDETGWWGVHNFSDGR